MSRVYFHSPSGEAELHGSERAWLGHVASGPATAAWDLDGTDAFARAAEILAMVPEVPDGRYGANYLHTYLREAEAQEQVNKQAYAEWRPGEPMTMPVSHEPQYRLVDALKTSLRVNGVTLRVAGHELRSINVGLNTALIAGSDPVRLAAKIHGWCESHCWVAGDDRHWLADVINEGLRTGIYRRGLHYSETPDGPRDKWSSQGWEEVTELLRSRDDEPVVTSYSVCEPFPNAEFGWMPPWPEGVPEDWDALTEEQEAEREARREEWSELAEQEQWRIAMAGLQQRRPWAQLTPDSLAATTFGPGVTVYDLLAPDRDERVSVAFAAV